MAACSEVGCSVSATCKATDFRRSGYGRNPVTRLVCDFHGQALSRIKGMSVKGLVDRAVGSSGRNVIDIRGAIERIKANEKRG